jgi:hypothetical protein
VHAIDLADILYQVRAVYAQSGPNLRVGIGSICHRGHVAEIRRIVAAIAAVLPGIPLHLFGAKLEVLAGWLGTDIALINAERRPLGLTKRR